MSQPTPTPTRSWPVILTSGAGVIAALAALVAALYPAHGKEVMAVGASLAALLGNVGSVLAHRGGVQVAESLHAENREAIRSVAREAGTQVPAAVEKQ